MNRFDDYYPLYEQNPAIEGMSDSELDERNEYINKLGKRQKNMTFDDWGVLYSDDLWYLWNIINEFTEINHSNLLCNMDYYNFCSMCYENSRKF
jgi:hypothetical protein